MDLLLSFVTDIDKGRLTESLIFLSVLLWKLSPHLKRIETRMDGVVNQISALNNTVSDGFAAGEKRFEHLEQRVSKLESKEN